MNNKLLSRIIDTRIYNQSRVKLLLDLMEFTLVIISILVSYFLVSFYNPGFHINPLEFFFFSMFLFSSWLFVSRITTLAKIPRTQRVLTIIFQFIQGNFLIFLILVSVKFIFQFRTIPLDFIAIYVFISFLSTVFFRISAYRFLKIYRANGYNLHQVLIIADVLSDNVIEKLIKQKEWGFKISGIITNSKLIRAKYGKDIKIYKDSGNLKKILDSNIIDEVIFCRKDIDETTIKRIVDICNEVGVIFRLQSSISPLEPFEIQLKTLNSTDFLYLVDTPSNRLSLIIKSMSDFYFSLIALIILAPVFLLITILIKLDSQGPVFFVQERIGLRGRKFKLIKFRTMVSNAEDLFESLRAKNEMDGPVFKIKDDPRITRLGRFLRRTCLDELPQFFNVLMGEMSLIGPRPPLEHEVKRYERWQLRRLSVKPGITCTWQAIPNRNDIKFEKWMAMDLKYIDNWSLGTDLMLLFKTIFTLFTPGGR